MPLRFTGLHYCFTYQGTEPPTFKRLAFTRPENTPARPTNPLLKHISGIRLDDGRPESGISLAEDEVRFSFFDFTVLPPDVKYDYDKAAFSCQLHLEAIRKLSTFTGKMLMNLDAQQLIEAKLQNLENGLLVRSGRTLEDLGWEGISFESEQFEDQFVAHQFQRKFQAIHSKPSFENQFLKKLNSLLPALDVSPLLETSRLFFEQAKSPLHNLPHQYHPANLLCLRDGLEVVTNDDDQVTGFAACFRSTNPSKRQIRH